ncbi:MAG: hypothetical protein QM793_14265 [Muricomes sp.]
MENTSHICQMRTIKVFVDNPEFMSEFMVDYGNIRLLRDKNYRSVLGKIKV